jgi:endo-1,4-beta-xylanase
MLTRREFLRRSAAAGLAAAASPLLHTQERTAFTPLRSSVRSGARIGAQATFDELHDEHFASFLATNFNTLTAGLEMKWAALRPSPTTYSFTRADWMVSFAERHQMHFHGHNLCWNHWLPGWVNTTLNKGNAERYLVDHISTVAGRYRGRIDSWDVVNEPLGTWYSRDTGQPPRPWLDLIGPEYLDVAFHAAAEADPFSVRVLNFDRLEQNAGPGDESHTRAFEMIRGLVQRNVPIQAVGFESHLVAWQPVENSAQDRLIRGIRDLGLKMLVTELDVNDTKISGTTERRDAVVASVYLEYLMKMVPQMQTEQVIFWTPADVDDWLDRMHGRDYDRPDGTPHRPGLFDSNLQPTAAYASVSNALRQLFG